MPRGFLNHADLGTEPGRRASHATQAPGPETDRAESAPPRLPVADHDRHDAILEAVTFAAQAFLADPAWEQRMPHVLERLGAAADASRVYVFESRPAPDGELRHYQRAEWAAPSIRPLIDEDWLQGFAFSDMQQERWERLLSDGEVIHGRRRDFPEHEQVDLIEQGILAIACVPVFVGTEWWGFIGFDECRTERDWSPAEIEALVGAAAILGAAISRQRTEAQYRALVESLPAVTYVEHPRPGGDEIVYVSPQIEQLLGFTPEEWLADADLWVRLLHPDDRDRVLAAEQHSADTGEPFREEFRYLLTSGREVWVRNEAVPVRDDSGRVISWQGVVLDISEQRAADERVRKAEERFRMLVEQLPAVTYVWAESAPGVGDFATTYISPQVESLLGWPPEEWIGDENDLWIETIHGDDRERVLAENARTDASGEPFVLEYRKLVPDGRVIWVHEEAQLVRGGPNVPREWQGVMFDITDIKTAEEELQRTVDLLQSTDDERRDLLARVVRAQEEERQRIAADIHDDSIQKMTAVGLRLEALRSLDIGEEGGGLLDRLGESVELAIRRLRRLMFELRPPALDREGLEAALRQYLHELATETNLVVRIDVHLDHEPPDEIRAIAYRIALEALANVRKHARADEVRVEVGSEDGGVRVRIVDDGVGFDPASLGHRPGHIGLSAIRERAELAGGTCLVASEPGNGTTVEFWLPDDRPTDDGETT